MMSEKTCEKGLEELNLETSLNILNDDCLIKIFHYLPITDQVRIERVCQRWRNLCDESWKNFKKIDLSKSTWGIDVYDDARSKLKIDLSFLKKHNAGKYVTYINFSNQKVFKRNGNNIITDIASNCPNLNELDLTGFKISKSEINLLAQNCGKIKKLGLGNFEGVSNKDLKALFSKNKNLTSLTIVNGQTVEGSCLLVLPADICQNLEELHLTGFKISKREIIVLSVNCSKIRKLSLGNFVEVSDQNLKALFLKNNNLNSLRIVDGNTYSGSCLLALPADNVQELFIKDFEMIGVLDPKMVFKAIKQLNNLKTLSLCMDMEIFTEDEDLVAITKHADTLTNLRLSIQVSSEDFTMRPIARLENLEYLDVSYCGYLKNPFLTDIGACCKKLKMLNITGCNRITNHGLSAITYSPELECLKMNHLEKVTDRLLENVTESLKILECHGCDEFSDKGLSKLISRCPKLELLDVSGCPKVSQAFVKAAAAATRARTNNVACTIYVGKTGVKPHDLSKAVSSPLLKVEMVDLSSSDELPFKGYEFGDLYGELIFGLPDDVDLDDIDDPYTLYHMAKDYEADGDVVSMANCMVALEEVFGWPNPFG